MKKIKVLVFCIILAFLLAGLLEGSSYLIQSHRLVKEGYRFGDDSKFAPYPIEIELFSNHYEKMNKKEFFENKKGEEYKKSAILIFGDVYANSLDIDNENNLTAKLANLLKRPVYNFASAGWGIPHLYFLLKNEEYLSTVKNPDTVVFIYNSDMKKRLTSYSFYPHHSFLNLKYKVEDGRIVEEIPQSLFLYHSYFFRVLERANGFRLAESKNPQIQQKSYELMKLLYEEARRVAQTRFAGINNFIILRYVSEEESINELSKNESCAISQLEYNMWTKLKNEGFNVIDISELSEENYNQRECFGDDYSPTIETLDELLPLFIKKANL